MPFFKNIILIILFILFIFTAMIDSVGGAVKVNNMLSTLDIPPKKSEIHEEAGWWSSWKSCMNVHTKCSKGSNLDGNAVSVEFSVYVYLYSYQLISEFKFPCNLCTETWKWFTETLPRRSRRKQTEYGCGWWRPGCVSSSWWFTVNQVNFNNVDAVRFLYSKNNIQMNIFILITT